MAREGLDRLSHEELLAQQAEVIGRQQQALTMHRTLGAARGIVSKQTGLTRATEAMQTLALRSNAHAHGKMRQSRELRNDRSDPARHVHSRASAMACSDVMPRPSAHAQACSSGRSA